MASGGAAMDLMGQWAPGAFTTQAGVDGAANLPFELGWFPFPSVDGGAGQPTDAFGGADGFAVGKDAPPEAVDFLKFITEAGEPARRGPPTAACPSTRRRRRSDRSEHAGGARRI